MTTKSMSPSEVLSISVGQNAKFFELQMAALRKSGLPREETQKVLETQGGALADKFVAMVSRRVRIMTNIIYFTVTSDGATGEQWIARLEAETGKPVDSYAKSVLCSSDFKPTSGVTYRIGVLKGSFWSDDERITKKIRSDAEDMDFSVLNAEVQCLIRMKFTDAKITAMGLRWIITMHEPIEDSDCSMDVLGSRVGGDYCIIAFDGNADIEWRQAFGFAFLAPQVVGT